MGRSIALDKAYGLQMSLPAGTVYLLPKTADKLISTQPVYQQLVQDRDFLEAVLKGKVAKKTAQVAIVKLFVTDFLRALKMTINRSVKLKDGKWSAGDINYYGLDEKRSAVPVNMTEGEVMLWAKKIKDGEAARLLAKPGAPPMSNPDVAEVNAVADAAEPLIDETGQAKDKLTQKRQELRKANKEVDVLMEAVWNYVQIGYQKLKPETQRVMLRNWGAVYASVGKPNTLTLVVKDSSGAALKGAKMLLLETESSATANPEGRATLKSRVVGNVTLRISYPGKADIDLPATIPDDVEGTTLDLGTVVME